MHRNERHIKNIIRFNAVKRTAIPICPSLNGSQEFQICATQNINSKNNKKESVNFYSIKAKDTWSEEETHKTAKYVVHKQKTYKYFEGAFNG